MITIHDKLQRYIVKADAVDGPNFVGPTEIVVYHRTKSVSTLHNIAFGGFSPGLGAMYGKGMYSTYTLRSQGNSRMLEVYGKFVGQFHVDIAKFLILDTDVAKHIHKGDFIEQLTSAGFGLDVKDIERMRNLSLNGTSTLAAWLTEPKAHMFMSDIKLHEIFTRFTGLIFTGAADGNVCVAYDLKVIKPIKYALWDDLTKPATDLRWKPFLHNPGLKGKDYPTQFKHIFSLPLPEAKAAFEELTDHLVSRDMWITFVENFCKLQYKDDTQNAFTLYLQSENSDKWFARVFKSALMVPELDLNDLDPYLDPKIYVSTTWKIEAQDWHYDMAKWLKAKISRIIMDKILSQWGPLIETEIKKYKTNADWFKPDTLERIRLLGRLEKWVFENIFPSYKTDRIYRDVLKPIYDKFWKTLEWKTSNRVIRNNQIKLFNDAFDDRKPDKDKINAG